MLEGCNTGFARSTLAASIELVTGKPRLLKHVADMIFVERGRAVINAYEIRSPAMYLFPLTVVPRIAILSKSPTGENCLNFGERELGVSFRHRSCALADLVAGTIEGNAKRIAREVIEHMQ